MIETIETTQHIKTIAKYTEIAIFRKSNIAVKLKRLNVPYAKRSIWEAGYFDKDFNFRHVYFSDLKEITNSLLYIDGIEEVSNADGTTDFVLNKSNHVFHPINDEQNEDLDAYICEQLKEGDFIEKLYDIVKESSIVLQCNRKYKHTEPAGYSEFDRLFQSISKPVITGNKKAFDYIKITINCSTTINADKIKEYRQQLDEKVIQSLEKDNTFNKYGIPVSMLEISDLVLTTDKRLVYTFDLKKALRTILKTD